MRWKDHMAFYIMLSIPILLPVRWFFYGHPDRTYFTGLEVMGHDYARVAVIYLLVLLLLLVADRRKWVIWTVILGQLVYLLTLAGFPVLMFHIPSALCANYIGMFFSCYRWGFYVVCLLTGISMLINIRELFR